MHTRRVSDTPMPTRRPPRRDTCLNSDGGPCKRVGVEGRGGWGCEARQWFSLRTEKGGSRRAAVGGSVGPTTVPLAAGASARLTLLRAGSHASHRADDRPVLTVMHAHIDSARVPVCARDVQLRDSKMTNTVLRIG